MAGTALIRGVTLLLVLALGLVVSIGVAGCGADDPAPDPVPIPEPVPEPAPEPALEPDQGDAESPDLDRVLIESKCSRCHNLERVWAKDQNRAQWDSTVARMEGQGLSVTDEERERIIDYLADQ